MIIDVKYDIGDVVKYIERRKDKVFGPCSCCDGDGYITGSDEVKYVCPKCRGEKQDFLGEKVSEEEKVGTLSSIHVRYDSNFDEDSLVSKFGRNKLLIYYHVLRSDYCIKQEDIVGIIDRNGKEKKVEREEEEEGKGLFIFTDDVEYME